MTTTWSNISSSKFYITIGSNNELVLKVDNRSVRDFTARGDMMDRILSMGAPYYYSKVVSDLMYKFDLLNEKSFGIRILEGVKQETTFHDKDQVIANLLNSLPSSKTKAKQDMNMLVMRYKELQFKYDKLKQEMDYLEEISKKRAHLYMYGGLLVVGGHFAFVSIGTYYVWSWDIVEPLAYFNGLF